MRELFVIPAIPVRAYSGTLASPQQIHCKTTYTFARIRKVSAQEHEMQITRTLNHGQPFPASFSKVYTCKG